MPDSARPTRHEVLIEVARTFARRSTCARNHVGCVIAQEGRILSTGYNGSPAGTDHCTHDCICGAESDPRHISHSSLCPANPQGSSGCVISVHAEVNAIAFAARHGVHLEGSSLYSTHLPCVSCSQLIIQAGIVQVVFETNYRIQTGLELMESAGIEVVSYGMI